MRLPVGVSPNASPVVPARPASEPTGRTQERTACPSTCTVQAPHCAMPQPNFVPVRPTISRSTQSSGVSGSISICLDVPLTSIVITGLSSEWVTGQKRRNYVATDCKASKTFDIVQGILFPPQHHKAETELAILVR